MKKTLATVLFFGLVSSSVFAKHGPAGCGLGQMLFKDKSGVFFNVLAATFNGTSGNQTFGMSTGTLGCEDASTSKVGAASFIEANQVALENDIARGNGETLAAYLQIINKDVEGSLLQENFSAIFSEDATPAQIHQNIVNVING